MQNRKHWAMSNAIVSEHPSKSASHVSKQESKWTIIELVMVIEWLFLCSHVQSHLWVIRNPLSAYCLCLIKLHLRTSESNIFCANFHFCCKMFKQHQYYCQNLQRSSPSCSSLKYEVYPIAHIVSRINLHPWILHHADARFIWWEIDLVPLQRNAESFARW